MITEAQKSEAMQRVYHFVKEANEQHGLCMSLPIVTFKQRGTCGGTALDDYKVDFNAGLMVDNWDEYMDQTIPHEVAHLVDFHINGVQTKRTRNGRVQRVAHGDSWKGIMRSFGIEPDRTHKMDVSKVAKPKSKFIYNCTCCRGEVVVGPKVHKKMQNGYTGYGHKGCRSSKLEFNRSVGKVTNREAMEMKAPAPKKAPAKKVTVIKPKSTKAPAVGSKIGTAFDAYQGAMKQRPNITRQEMITVIADVLGIERKAAAGYYQNCKKKAA